MFEINNVISSGGLLLLGIFLFAEVGLFLGFFLPGDTLLISAGIFASQGKMNLISIFVVAIIAAILGDNTAYLIGRHAGPKLFKNEDSAIFNPKHVKTAEKFYAKHGAKTVLVAHYLPVIRTFTPLLAGVAKMNHRKYIILDGICDITWAVALTLVGYFIGNRIPNVDRYILITVILVVVASASPTIYQWIKIKRRHKKAKEV